jgi:hypothetical protein
MRYERAITADTRAELEQKLCHIEMTRGPTSAVIFKTETGYKAIIEQVPSNES